MTTEQRYPIGLSRGSARVADLTSWIRLTATATFLFGPLRWIVLASGRLGRRRLMHRLERMWATVMIQALGIRLTVDGTTTRFGSMATSPSLHIAFETIAPLRTQDDPVDLSLRLVAPRNRLAIAPRSEQGARASGSRR